VKTLFSFFFIYFDIDQFFYFFCLSA